MDKKDKKIEFYYFLVRTCATLMGLLIAIVALIDRLEIRELGNTLILTFVVIGISFTLSYATLVNELDDEGKGVLDYMSDLRIILPLIIYILIGYLLVEIGRLT